MFQQAYQDDGCHLFPDSPTPTGVDLSNIVKLAPKVSADGPQEPTHDILQVGRGGPCGQGWPYTCGSTF